eukprot:JP446194.1.p3 GENE.JP446194.1~~JP446194.1.p3  ORF type:complete len:156 (-),score=0.71 JP446194.1:453-920(-)
MHTGQIYSVEYLDSTLQWIWEFVLFNVQTLTTAHMIQVRTDCFTQVCKFLVATEKNIQHMRFGVCCCSQSTLGPLIRKYTQQIVDVHKTWPIKVAGAPWLPNFPRTQCNTLRVVVDGNDCPQAWGLNDAGLDLATVGMSIRPLLGLDVEVLPIVA